MTSPCWSAAERHRIDELVLATAGLDPAQREPILTAGPSPDTDEDPIDETAVLAEVRRRLAAADAADEGFLESPLSLFLGSALGTPEQFADVPVSETFADLAASERFEVEKFLGRGGMAEVYSAFDRRLNRRVALKLLDHSDPMTEQRFLDEARAQARIRHENVLGIYDVGRLGERPFLAMERVDGGTLSEEAPSLPLEEKVKLAAQAAEGLHAAHRQGLIHRDVKPSNILVGRTERGERRAWVTDFGIAVGPGLVDQESGSLLLGTPHYMAPERIERGDTAVDRRSDVWSLGVTLYQVLAGGLPFDADTPLRVLRAIREGQPTPLGEREPSLPADLVAIVDKCLCRDPEERYASARAVSEDLHRYLDGDVVEAHTAGLAYRLTRFAQRHRTLLTVAGLLGAGLLVALVAAAVLGVQAMRSQRALEQRQLQAERLVSFMLGDLRERLEPLGRLDLLDAVGDEAMSYFAAVPESELSEDELGRRSQALYQIGSVRQLQGDLAGAKVAFDQSLALSESLWHRNTGDFDRTFGLAQSHFWIGYALWEGGNRDEAGRHFERYLDLSRRLVDLAPERHDAWMELYYAHSNLGSWQQERGELDEALKSFEQAHVVLTEGLPATDPDDPDWRFELAAAENSLGLVKRSLGRVAEADDHIAAELAHRRRFFEDHPEDPAAREFLATALQHSAALGLSQQRPAEARRALLEAGDLLDELVLHDPENGGWRYKRLWARLQASHAAFATGDIEQARDLARNARADAQTLATADPSQIDWRRAVAVTQVYSGRCAIGGGFFSAEPALLAGNPKSAQHAVTEALAILQRLAVERPEDRKTHRWLAEALLLAADLDDLPGRVESATAYRHRARDVLEPWAATSSDPEISDPWNRILRTLEP